VTEQQWQVVPVGLDAPRYVTRPRCKSVLVAVHTMVSAQRLMDVVGLIEADHRLQLVYSQGPAAFSGGVDNYLKSIGVLEIPWAQALHERFDLALAAAHADIDRIHAPLMVFPHGAAFGKRASGSGPVYGLDAGRLMRDGRVVPSSLVLSHDSQLETLARQCRPAVEVAVVAGDPCYDLLVASERLREDYRWALGARHGRELVLVASTWGRHSLFHRFEHYLPALLQQLDPMRYRVAMLIHPAVWFAHGRRQVRAWLSAARSAGLVLVEPEVDWRAALLAADYLIGDHGSTTVYGAALGRPLLCTDLPIDALNPESPQAYLGLRAPRLNRSRPIEPQLRAAAEWQTTIGRDLVAAQLTSRPGDAHRLLRAEMYRLLNLPMLDGHRPVEPVPVPATREG
jgi:hypothetical protein